MWIMLLGGFCCRIFQKYSMCCHMFDFNGDEFYIYFLFYFILSHYYYFLGVYILIDIDISCRAHYWTLLSVIPRADRGSFSFVCLFVWLKWRQAVMHQYIKICSMPWTLYTVWPLQWPYGYLELLLSWTEMRFWWSLIVFRKWASVTKNIFCI